MQQILFRIPIRVFDWMPSWLPESLPVPGFGIMLFLAFVICIWLGGRRAEKRGIPREVIQDLAFWIFLGGLAGARTVFMIQYDVPLRDFYKIWEGGIVFYGSMMGGIVGYALGYYFVLRKHRLAWWKVADVVAPLAALGLAIGRFGCLLNGCCFGGVACPDDHALHFPLSAPPRFALVAEGYQTPAGFTMDWSEGADPRTVGAVDPHSPAYAAGLKPGDVIVEADDHVIRSYGDLQSYLGSSENWPRGKKDLALTVQRGGETVELPPFEPRTLGLHPTQLYESVSMFLLFLLLLAYEPFRRRDGELFTLFVLLYPVHRFLNEVLRNDTDPVALGMTLSQNGSLLVFAAGVVLAAWLSRQPVAYPKGSALAWKTLVTAALVLAVVCVGYEGFHRA